MSQPPRERVLTALNHEEPDRVPFAWGFGPTGEASAALDEWLKPYKSNFAQLHRLTSDIRSVSPRYIGPKLPENTNIWGIPYKKISYGSGNYNEIESYPLGSTDSLDDLNNYPWPKPEYYDYSDIAGQIEREGENGRYAILSGMGGNPFEMFSWLVGLEETLIKLMLNPEFVHLAMTHITDFFEGHNNKVLEAAGGKIDMVFTADDLGTQHGLMISTDTYRRIIQPYHEKLHDGIHEFGAWTLYHSDGAVAEILPDLIDAGVDILEAVQVDAAGMIPEDLKKRFGKDLCFHGGVSVQKILPFGNPDTVREEVAQLKKTFGAGGGYICAPTHAIQAGTPPENVIAMVEEATEQSIDDILKTQG